jgi:hypothetical protein
MVPELRVVIEVNTMDHHLHMLTAYVDSKFTGKRDRKLLIFSVLVTATVRFMWMNNACRSGCTVPTLRLQILTEYKELIK